MHSGLFFGFCLNGPAHFHTASGGASGTAAHRRCKGVPIPRPSQDAYRTIGSAHVWFPSI
jgi:hypothetical protein